MHPLLWNLLQLLLHNARDLHDPGAADEETNPEYTRGQVNLIMDAVGLSGDENVYEILTDVIRHRTGEIDALVKLQRLLQK